MSAVAGSLRVSVPPTRHALGAHSLSLGASGVSAQTGGVTIWRTVPGEAFVRAYRGWLKTSGTAGHLYLSERISERFTQQSVTGAESTADALVLTGELSSRSGGRVGYELRFTAVDDQRLGIELRLTAAGARAASEAATQHEPAGATTTVPAAATAAEVGLWTELAWQRELGAKQFGLGVQFSRLDMAGRRVPVLTAEQGVGRGAQPITFLANLKGGAGGRWWSTYAPAPVVLGTDLRGLYLTDTHPCQFDFRAPGRSSVRLYAPALSARAFAAPSPSALLEVYTRFSGRMEPLPDWVHGGAIVGLQGGPEKAERIVADLQRHGAPVAAVWLQDWVGNRKVGFGQRLWWDWQLDRQRYPDWDAMRERLARAGVVPMIYVNPFLADMTDRPGDRPALYDVAEAAGYFVKRADGSTYATDQGDFKAGLMDLSNPEAREWYLETLTSKIGETGALGWMADFGEGLPLDAVLAGGTALEWHNHYPQAWAELNAELRQRLAAASGLRPSDYVTFFRSGYSRSPAHARLFWLGDQTVTWDRHDGLASALTGLLSSGFSGFALQHSDVGGYTSTVPPLPKLVRDRELLARWGELMAFSPVLRTHEGNRPSLNVQVYDDETTLADYARAAKLHAAWRPLRARLMAEAAASGLPVVRHAWLAYPDDPRSTAIDRQFFLGPDLLVAPVLQRGAASVSAYLPKGSGSWLHVLSGDLHDASDGRWVTVPAPLGQPGLLVRTGAEAAADGPAAARAGGSGGSDDGGSDWRARLTDAVRAAT